ncbi:MAG: DEAD/DEAH box helicase [Muribaculaceae bacterium]|nr:DEAD/DEAH box helicase [Muribaculaceae bacterium]
MRFDQLLENDDLLDALWDMHFDECTPIQEQAIPAVLEGRDLLACAQTGTGKTAAYLLPVIDLLSTEEFPSDAINCVIMAPTRELAQQIDQQMQGFSYFLPVSSMPVYGGTDGHTYDQQRRSLKAGADVVIATPGRLIAHLAMGYVDLSKVSFFILDEADRMLDMGFFDDIMQIVGRLPKERQTLLFSATMPPKIQQLAEKILNNPHQIKLAVSKPADKIMQKACVCYETQKLPILLHLFKENPPEKVIVFSSSKLKVKELAKALRKEKYKVGEMHSDLDQDIREDVILDFKSGKINVLVATDIVARGIDIDDIRLVVNFDVPHEAEDYVHRVGRTARADRDGAAITFITDKDAYKFRRIEQLLEKEVEKMPLPAELGEGPNYSSGRGASGRKSGSRANQGKRTRKGKTPRKPAPASEAQGAEAKPSVNGLKQERTDTNKSNRKRRQHHHRRRKPKTDKPATDSTASSNSSITQ